MKAPRRSRPGRPEPKSVPNRKDDGKHNRPRNERSRPDPAGQGGTRGSEEHRYHKQHHGSGGEQIGKGQGFEVLHPTRHPVGKRRICEKIDRRRQDEGSAPSTDRQGDSHGDSEQGQK